MRRRVLLALAFAGALGLGAAGGAIGEHEASRPPARLPAGMTLALLGHAVSLTLHREALDGALPAVAIDAISATCVPPAGWQQGAHFSCQVYGPSRALLGTALGTVGLGARYTVAFHEAPAGQLPVGVTLGMFDKGLLTQLRQKRSQGGFDVPKAHSLNCVPPSRWVPGRTFTCYAYDHIGHELGTITGTVLPEQNNNPLSSNLTWNPSGATG